MKSQPLQPLLLDEETARKRALFNNANVEELPPLYFEANSFDLIAAMYSDVIAKQHPPVVEDAKPGKGGKGGKGTVLIAHRVFCYLSTEVSQENCLIAENWNGF